MPAPTKYTRERAQTVLEAIRQGNTRKTAAALAGIGERTLYDWTEANPQFSQDLEKADAQAEQAMVRTVVQSSAENWTAAAWWLERRRNSDWGRKDKHEITGKDGEALAVELTWGDSDTDEAEEAG